MGQTHSTLYDDQHDSTFKRTTTSRIKTNKQRHSYQAVHRTKSEVVTKTRSKTVSSNDRHPNSIVRKNKLSSKSKLKNNDNDNDLDSTPYLGHQISDQIDYKLNDPSGNNYTYFNHNKKDNGASNFSSRQSSTKSKNSSTKTNSNFNEASASTFSARSSSAVSANGSTTTDNDNHDIRTSSTKSNFSLPSIRSSFKNLYRKHSKEKKSRTNSSTSYFSDSGLTDLSPDSENGQCHPNQQNQMPQIKFNKNCPILQEYIVNYQQAFQTRWEKKYMDSDSKPSDYLVLKCLGKGTFGEVHLCSRVESKLNQKIESENKEGDNEIENNNNNDHNDAISSTNSEDPSTPSNSSSENHEPINIQPGQPVAIKTLKFEKMHRLKQTDHVKNERRILYSLKSKFTVNLIETFCTKSDLYLVMEFVSGGELFYYMHKKKILPINQVKFYIAQIATALHHMHTLDIIYRDLKPENILIGTDGYLKITDFGFAKRLARGSRAWTLCGTPDFLAPEIILSRGYNRAVDWWAMGVLLYEMLVGKTPFVTGQKEKDQPMEIYQRIVNTTFKPGFPKKYNSSPEVKSLINALLQRDRSKRLGCLENEIYDIYQHKFFGKTSNDRNFYFASIFEKSIEADYVPKVADGFDTSFFMDF